MLYSNMTEVQQAFIEYAIARAKFEILDDMSFGNIISKDVTRYDELGEYVQHEDYGGLRDEDMITYGEHLFPVDDPAFGFGYMDACAMIRTAVDEWLRSR